MVFSSMTFVPLFLPFVLAAYFITKNPVIRNSVLLAFSLLFYAWGEPKWILVMLLTVTVNYLCALLMDRAKSTRSRTVCMVIGVGLSLAFLFYFKYFSFFYDSITSLFGLTNNLEKIVLPIGISFYTFQVLTYTVDVYRRKTPVQKNYANLLMYISFFPQLIAGPIVNYTDIAPSLKERKIDRDDIFEGFQRFFIGLGKKILLANTCGIVTDKLFAGESLSFAGSWLMAFAYALQIYFDFSGYSDMAIGMGRMFGFHFLENFNYPYISRSITEFWRRWHISLGTFFRDYVYIPLGGNRVSLWKSIRNILIVWMLTGFWHGASWNFIVWGLYYGVLLLAEKFVFKSVKEKLPAAVNLLLTLVFVLIGWVFFYYESLSDGLQHIGIMFGLVQAELCDPVTVYYFKHYLVFFAVSVLACIPWKTILPRNRLSNTVSWWLKPLAITAIFIFSMGLIVTQSYNPFLYFRF